MIAPGEAGPITRPLHRADTDFKDQARQPGRRIPKLLHRPVGPWQVNLLSVLRRLECPDSQSRVKVDPSRINGVFA